MPESFAEQLDHLAPGVDMAASRAAFERATGGASRRSWLLPAAVVTLLVAGVVGLWAFAGRGPDGSVPAVDPATTTLATIPDGPIASGGGFEVLHVAETTTGFGLAALVTSADGYEDWMNPAPDVADVDFGRSVVLVLTRPDNACADTLTQFVVETSATGERVWTPTFVAQTDVCEDPLLSWLYVVELDRAALGPAATILIPADDLYGVAEQRIEYRATDDAANPSDTGQPVALEATGIMVPLPDVGRPTLHNTSAGLVWVVHHEDGSVSVLPATMDARLNDSGITGLGELVLVADDGTSFFSGGFAWDDHGRAFIGGRASDLVGYAGRVESDEVELLVSDATRIAGDATPREDWPSNADPSRVDEIQRVFGNPIDPGTFMTLSSSGPIWRYLDASLVVENGVGRICQTDAATLDQVIGCSTASIVLDTSLTSPDPDVRGLYGSPILAFQDPLRGFTRVIPLGNSEYRLGSASTVGAEPGGESNVTVLRTELECRDSVGLVIAIDFEFTTGGSVEFVVMDGDVELGSATASGGTAGTLGVGFPLSAPPSPSALLLVSSADVAQTVPLTDLGQVSCPSAGLAGFREIAVDQTDLPFGKIYALGSESELITLWDELQPGLERPTTIDFGESVALVVTIPGDACADELDRFERTEDNWLAPVFEIPESEAGCAEVGWSWIHIIAVDRRELDDSAGFRLPADPSSGYTTAEAPLPSASG